MMRPRPVVHDGDGHVISAANHRSQTIAVGGVGGGEMVVPRIGGSDGTAAASGGVPTGQDGVATIRFQELYSRASRHLVRVTGSRVDALGNATSPYGKSPTTDIRTQHKV